MMSADPTDPDDARASPSCLMPEFLTYRFGACEVHPGRREIRRAGTVCPVSHKPFELLLLLLRERHRALSKQELLQRLWPGLQVTDSVLPRAVMRARQAIGDDSEEPVWIGNVRGFGYRFIGPVQEVAPADARLSPASGPALAAPPPAPAPGRSRIGVMPCQNMTGDAAMAWTRIGLMALVGHALELAPGFQVLPVDQLAPFDDTAQSGAQEEPVQRALELLALDHVVQAALRRQGSALWMDYQVHSRGQPPLPGSLRDSEPVRLAERLAEAVARAISPNGKVLREFLSTDAFVNQAYARATEFATQEDWASALRLVEAARVLEPDSTPLHLAQVRCLVWLKDERAVALARELLAQLPADADALVTSKCHDLLALALAMRGEPALQPEALHHRAQALACAERSGSTDWHATMLLNLANLEIEDMRLASAEQHYLQAEERARAAGNQPLRAIVMQNHSLVYRARGDLVAARQQLDAAMHIWRRLQRRPITAHALGLLAQVNAALGLVDDALAQCREAVTLVEARQLRGFAGLVMASVALVCLELGDARGLAEVQALVDRDWPPHDPDHPTRQAVLACSALGRGDGSCARGHLRTAIAHGHWPGLTFTIKWQLALLWLETAYGDPEQLRACASALQALHQRTPLPELLGGLRCAEAALAHRRGDDATARALLQRAVDEVPMGRIHHLARFDLAWLLTEAGDVAQAGTLLAGAPTWRAAHPFGLATQARWLAEQGRLDQAQAAQAQALAAWRRAPPPAQAALAQGYAHALATGQVPRAGRLPQLMSASWLLVA